MAAPISIVLGSMVGLDELRKVKGLEPIFVPYLADKVFTDSETSQIFKEQRKLETWLIENDKASTFIFEELKIVDNLKKKII